MGRGQRNLEDGMVAPKTLVTTRLKELELHLHNVIVLS